MSEPLFTIAIAAYNYGHYLGEAVRSVLAQTFTSFEVVISDDVSKDDTFEVAQQFAQLDPRVRAWRNEKNLGSQKNINKCYREARGRYVVPLQADDAFLRPDHLARMAAVIAAHPKVGFIFNAGYFVTNEGVIARRYSPLLGDTIGPGRYFLSQLSRLPPWPTFTAIDRVLLNQLGGEEETLVVADFEVTMRIAYQTEVAYLAAPTTISRVHDQAQGIRQGCDQEAAVVRNNLACLDSFAAKFPDDAFAQRVIGGTKSLFAGGYRKVNNGLYHAGHLAAQLNPRLADWRRAGKRIGVYAAGEHTRRLFEWTDLKPQDVICLMDANPAAHGTMVAGCRIQPPEAGVAAKLDVVIVSSVSQQEEILFALGVQFPAATELVTLYPRQYIGLEEARKHLRPIQAAS